MGFLLLIVFVWQFVCYWQIANKAGYSGWWGLVMIIPFVGLIVVWMFPFMDWPILTRRRATLQCTAPPKSFPSSVRQPPMDVTSAPEFFRAVSSNNQRSEASMPTTNTPISRDEDAIYATVAEEMENEQLDKGLWIRLFAEFDGDEKKTKIAYIKQRAEKLLAVEQARIQELERQRVEAATLAEKARLDGEKKAFIQRLCANEARLKKIRQVAAHHKSNPRLTVDEKASLLCLAGGDFKWLDGYGKCSAFFCGQEMQFSSGYDFANWFMDEVVPFLMTIGRGES